MEIKRKLAEFIGGMLKMELSEEKTLITHSSEYARFLGYDVRIRRDGKIRRVGKLKQSKRTLNNKAELVVPLDDKTINSSSQKALRFKRKTETCDRPPGGAATHDGFRNCLQL